jgi:hypothetical protein
MKPLQIVLFVIGNIIFLSQLGRHTHQLALGAKPSVLDKFEVERTKAMRWTPSVGQFLGLDKVRLTARETYTKGLARP